MKLKRNILLNPGPATTTDTVKQALVVPDLCPREEEFCRVLRSVERKLCRVVHAEETHSAVLLCGSGTCAVEAALASVFQGDAKILIHVNGAYGQRMVDIARAYYPNESILVYEQDFGAYPDLKEIERTLKRDPQIRYLAFVHHETTTGMLNPAQEMNEVASVNGVRVIVDAMSSYAGIPIDFRESEFDILISSANKCIQGMAGLSFAICKKELLSQMKASDGKGYYLNLWKQFETFQKTGQMQFTPPVQIIFALNQALDEFFKETVEGRYARYAESWSVLTDGLQKLGFQFLLPSEYQSKLLTAILEPEGFHFQEMHDYLYERGFTIYPGKIPANRTFRIANIGAIDSTDIRSFLKEMENYCSSKTRTW